MFLLLLLLLFLRSMVSTFPSFLFPLPLSLFSLALQSLPLLYLFLSVSFFLLLLLLLPFCRQESADKRESESCHASTVCYCDDDDGAVVVRHCHSTTLVVVLAANVHTTAKGLDSSCVVIVLLLLNCTNGLSLSVTSSLSLSGLLLTLLEVLGLLYSLPSSAFLSPFSSYGTKRPCVSKRSKWNNGLIPEPEKSSDLPRPPPCLPGLSKGRGGWKKEGGFLHFYSNFLFPSLPPFGSNFCTKE